MANFAAFEFSPDNNSGNWRIATGAATTPSYTNTSVAVAADTFYDLELDINAAGSQILAYINGVLAATITTNLPTGTLNLSHLHVRSTTPSTNFYLYTDYWYLTQLTAR